MRNTKLGTGAALLVASAGIAAAATTYSTQHGELATSLDAQIASNDLLAGLIATELPGDLGWHPANSNPADQLPAFTDGAGILGSGLTGLLNDFPAAGAPTKSIQYDLTSASDIGSIRILTGNNGRDGRIFSTTVIRYSTNGVDFDQLGYFQSDPSGTLNNGGSDPRYGSTLVTIFDDSGSDLLSGITNLQFDFYAVDNTQGEMRDPFDGMNPFTGVDDGLTAPNSSPLVFEIDVIPEPASFGLLALGGLALIRRR